MSPVIPIAGIIWIVRKLAAGRKSVAPETGGVSGEVLCRTCTHSLIRKDVHGKESICCHYANEVSTVEIEVRECSGFHDRRAKHPAKVVGFIQPGDTRGHITIIRIACNSDQ
jgi:hypothetical protein